MLSHGEKIIQLLKSMQHYAICLICILFTNGAEVCGMAACVYGVCTKYIILSVEGISKLFILGKKIQSRRYVKIGNLG